jgi:hypothetical protein
MPLRFSAIVEVEGVMNGGNSVDKAMIALLKHILAGDNAAIWAANSAAEAWLHVHIRKLRVSARESLVRRARPRDTLSAAMGLAAPFLARTTFSLLHPTRPAERRRDCQSKDNAVNYMPIPPFLS